MSYQKHPPWIDLVDRLHLSEVHEIPRAQLKITFFDI